MFKKSSVGFLPLVLASVLSFGFFSGMFSNTARAASLGAAAPGPGSGGAPGRGGAPGGTGNPGGGGGSHPQPPPPQPTPAPVCQTNCSEFEPDYPSICADPEVTHKRDCETYCDQGMSFTTTERLCLPLANYEPQFFSNDDGDEFTVHEEEPFTSTAACSGQWWVDISTLVQYGEGNPEEGEGGLNLMSQAMEECRK